ncbi:gliding motility-associated C-terminal domain-containing protein [Cytophagaceae bacterium ABcell3]|nr:gliding motility-associated C-terminal domain-containing protein [Cytophagaceae bacterium ABcell3]
MKRIFILFFLLLFSRFGYSQLNEFASLEGWPDIFVQGWHLMGEAYTGSTQGGDIRPEVILVDNSRLDRAGGAFFSLPFDAGACQRWRVTFDFRIFDGNGADGLAFSFLRELPQEQDLRHGSKVGLPAFPRGLAVVFDTYNNRVDNDYSTSSPAFCEGENPEIQIFYGDGTVDYDECSELHRVERVSGLRSSSFNTARVDYDNGQLKVFLNGTLMLEGAYDLNYKGYFGFSASTGGRADNHSIKNVSIEGKTPAVDADAGEDQVICDGEEVRLGGDQNYPENYVFEWSPNLPDEASSLQNPTVRPQANGHEPANYLYTLKAGDPEDNCFSYDEVRVTVNPLPNADAGNDKEICIGQEVEIGTTPAASGGLPPYNYQWLQNDRQVASGCETAVVSPEVPSTYYLSVSDANGCIGKDSMWVDVIPVPLPVVSVSEPFELCEGNKEALATHHDNDYNYLWNTGERENEINITRPGHYWVEVTPVGGCTVRDSVYISHCKPEIQAVNLFTPDGNGLNDTFKIGAKDYSKFSLSIYNRWGSRVFYSEDPEDAWDGMNSSDGVYYWHVKIKGFDKYDFWEHYKGVLTLLRDHEQ